MIGDTATLVPPPRLAAAREILMRAIDRGAAPAASVEVGSSEGVLWREPFGSLTWDADAPRASSGTVFDLASLTKVVVTTTLALRFVEIGALRLETRLAECLPLWRGDDREGVTVRDLLEHASGLTSYLPFFRDCVGRADFERAICSLPLECAPRTVAVYSDLGFILLGFILDDLAGSNLATTFAREVPPAVREALTFRPSGSFRSSVAPTRISEWRGRLSAGDVDDDNAWALGGIAGHAGLFGTAPGVGTFARAVLRGLRGLESGLPLRPETLQLSAKRGTVPGSSRGLGWDTMVPTSSCGTKMHPTAIGHTGSTGTSLWIDWEADLYAVLLSNRVHPAGDNESWLAVRPLFHDAVMAGLFGDGAGRS